MIKLVDEFGAEGVLTRLVAELEKKVDLLPENTVSESGHSIFERLQPLLEQAHQIAAELDREIRRCGFQAGQLPKGEHVV
jgi:hypothetical protein